MVMIYITHGCIYDGSVSYAADLYVVIHTLSDGEKQDGIFIPPVY